MDRNSEKKYRKSMHHAIPLNPFKATIKIHKPTPLNHSKHHHKYHDKHHDKNHENIFDVTGTSLSSINTSILSARSNISNISSNIAKSCIGKSCSGIAKKLSFQNLNMDNLMQLFNANKETMHKRG